ncbi:MAG: hypothetical protein F6K41_43095 [Symploca sp. SIO3E6]|nr:hypothetical protein [Caldora sp. SIO3E6]
MTSFSLLFRQVKLLFLLPPASCLLPSNAHYLFSQALINHQTLDILPSFWLS